jgi:hypothetical protein
VGNVYEEAGIAHVTMRRRLADRRARSAGRP